MTSSSKTTERQLKILNHLNSKGRVDVVVLSSELSVSLVTIRSDLKFLERNQLLRRIRGGAVAVRASRFKRPVDINASLRVTEKTAIAIEAVRMIRDGETVMLGSGSTVEALAAQIRPELRDVAVLTNSLNVALLLANHPAVTVIVTGGTLRPTTNSLIDPYGCTVLNEINADIAFIGCSGVALEKGFTTTSWHEAAVSKAMIRAAHRTVFLADHSKFDQVATARIADLHEAEQVITDKRVGNSSLEVLRAAGLRITVARAARESPTPRALS